MPARSDSALPVERKRRLALQGAVNFRDLGGYVGADGRTVRWGQVFRSDSWAELTGADLERLGRLGIRLVCDLRLPIERAAKPDRLPAADPPELLHLGFSPRGMQELIGAVAAGTIDVAEMEAAIEGHYRQFPREHHEECRAIIDRVIERRYRPAVIHCTSGKDRTGFAVALLLLALGVSEETVLEDYVLSNDYKRDIMHIVGPTVRPDLLSALTSVNARYLQAALASIHEIAGSVDAYLAASLNLSETRLRTLRDELLE